MSNKKKTAGSGNSTAAKKKSSKSIIAEPIDIVNMSGAQIVEAAINRLQKEDSAVKYDRYGKIMHSDVRCSAMCVRVSSLRSHSESVWIETELKITPDEARRAFEAAPGITLKDDPSQLVYPMPLETAGHDEVYVGRIREDLAFENGLTFWLSGDQIRKGAALNAVQIAEYLISVGNIK